MTLLYNSCMVGKLVEVFGMWLVVESQSQASGWLQTLQEVYDMPRSLLNKVQLLPPGLLPCLDPQGLPAPWLLISLSFKFMVVLMVDFEFQILLIFVPRPNCVVSSCFAAQFDSVTHCNQWAWSCTFWHISHKLGYGPTIRKELAKVQYPLTYVIKCLLLWLKGEDADWCSGILEATNLLCSWGSSNRPFKMWYDGWVVMSGLIDNVPVAFHEKIT